MAEIVTIGAGRGSYLATIEFYRLPSGEISAVLRDMAHDQIEQEPSVSARFTKLASWCLHGVLDLMRQGLRFDEEHRATIANDRGDA